MSRRLSLRALAFTQAMLLLATLLLPALVAAATIQTDLFVYQDGDTVTVTGDGFGPGELVDYVTTDPEGIVVDTGNSNSDDLGNVSYAFTLHATVSGIYTVIATGEASGLSATTQFDPVNVTIANGLTVYRAGANISLNGTYTCTSPQCGTAVSVLVEIFLSNGTNNTVSGSPVLSATAGTFGGGSWSQTFVGGGSTLTDGSLYDVRASLNFSGGTGTSPNRIVKDDIIKSDKTAPGAPTVTGTTPASPANNNTPTVNGTTEGGATVSVYTNSSCSGAQAGSDVANNPGAFAASVTVANDTTTTFWALATDAAGNASPCSATSAVYTEDSTNVAPVVTGTTPASPNQNTGPTVDGTAEPGSTVTVWKSSNCSTGGQQGSGTAALTGAFHVTVSVAPNSTTTFWAKSTDVAGNASTCSTTFATYNADNNGPTVVINSSPTNPTTLLAANFTFTPIDGGANASGVAFVECRLDSPTWGPCTTPTSFSGTVVGTGSHTFGVRATDYAGNVGNQSTYTWTVNSSDSTGPVITYQLTGTPGSNGWYTSDVFVDWTVTDPESAVVIDSGCVDQTLSAETAGTNLSCAAHSAGGSSTGSLTVKLDKTGPSANLAVTAGTLGANSWYTSDVTVSTTGSDSISEPTVCTADQTQTSETAGTAFNGSCTNDAGLTTNASSLTVKLDKTGPSVLITSPSTGYITVGSTVVVGGDASDNISDVDGVAIGTSSATLTTGHFLVTVGLTCGSNVLYAIATNGAGLQTTSGSITVTRICVSNFQYYQPLDMSTTTPVINTGKYGRVIPVKVTGSVGTSLLTQTFTGANGLALVIGVNTAVCSNGSATDDVEAYADAGTANSGTNQFRWDTTGNQWIYNLDTKAPPNMTMQINNCYRLDVYLLDAHGGKLQLSTSPYALFKPTK
jgi:hypothetical protein